MKLSVCIVTYNHEPFIGECLESVLKQETDFPFEIVIGEDKSTDGTLAIVEALARKNPGRIKVMARGANMGAELNFNQTVSECKGEYIAFLEGDNYWLSANKLSRQVEFLETNPAASFCFHRAVYIDHAGEKTGTIVPLQDPAPLSGMEFILQDFNPVPFGSMVVRRNLLKGFDKWVSGLKLGDWPICMLLANLGAVGFLPEDWSVQRVHGKGTWQLVPDFLKLIFITQALEQVKPRLSVENQRAITQKIKDFDQRLMEHLEVLRQQSGKQLVGRGGGAATGSAVTVDEAVIDRLLTDALVELLNRASKLNEREAEFFDLLEDLARVRCNPLKAEKDLLNFRLLTYLLGKRHLFSQKLVAKFESSAAKRDPQRSLRRFGEDCSTPTTTSQTSFKHFAGKVRRDWSRRNVIVVCHELSRTGAPILGLNLARALSERYNVVTICLRDGDLLRDFREVSTNIHVARRFFHDGAHYSDALVNICDKTDFEFAFVNSMESRGVLKGLSEAQVPIVSLIHEFASYTNPKTAVLEVFKRSNQIVFSTDVTLENSLFESDWSRTPDIHVLPQGRCEIPQSKGALSAAKTEIKQLTEAMRPDSDTNRRFVLIGAGTVDIRKGVDLFLQVAARLIAGPGGDRYRFVWFGNGYAPDKDLGYSVYIRDQLRRSGLEDKMRFYGATAAIDAAYELSDAMLLSSRLDPLPNVAVDSMSVGRPVFCFDQTGGIPRVLVESGLGKDCVADYLDVAGLASKIRALAEDGTVYQRVAERSKDVAAEAFSFGRYVESLLEIAQHAKERSGAGNDTKTGPRQSSSPPSSSGQPAPARAVATAGDP